MTDNTVSLSAATPSAASAATPSVTSAATPSATSAATPFATPATTPSATPARQAGIVFCVSGPSGVGKGTVIDRIRALRPAITHSVSATTRPPRLGEVDGLDYFFLGEDAFRTRIAAGEMLEYDQYCGHLYGTPRRFLEQEVAAGRDILLDITVAGSLSILEKDFDCVTVFLLPPSMAELEARLRGRATESAEVIAGRLTRARLEITYCSRFQYVVVNSAVDAAASRILAIVDAEHSRYIRQAGIETRLLESGTPPENDSNGSAPVYQGGSDAR